MHNADRHIDLLLTSGTVLEDWFSPMVHSVEKQRFGDAANKALPMVPFVLSGCLRHLLSSSSLRDYLQSLFHLDVNQSLPPLARSTWSDAMASTTRRDVVRQALAHLVTVARKALPDRLAHVEGLGSRAVIATDATYQDESVHFYPHYPMSGGVDNQKGHMLLSHYDLRCGIPLAVTTETQSIGEMRVLKKEEAKATSLLRTPCAVHVVDRAFIDARFWDQRCKLYRSTVITRMKSTLKYEVVKENEIVACPSNEGVLYDRIITLQSSQEKWRLVGFRSPDDIEYEYLTNDKTLLPGVVAFLYHRRWDKEKYYDCFKNDLAGAKAWGKSPIAIELQALFGIVTVILTRLFMQRRQADLSLEVPDLTQNIKHEKKKLKHEKLGAGIMLRVHWSNLSKITRQIWRFLKNCFTYQHEPTLYKRQLEPLLRQYL